MIIVVGAPLRKTPMESITVLDLPAECLASIFGFILSRKYEHFIDSTRSVLITMSKGRENNPPTQERKIGRIYGREMYRRLQWLGKCCRIFHSVANSSRVWLPQLRLYYPDEIYSLALQVGYQIWWPVFKRYHLVDPPYSTNHDIHRYFLVTVRCYTSSAKDEWY